jgi:hypothetical protein
MIKEDYVPFEVAKILKEKGFDEYFGTSYTTAGGNPIPVMGSTYSLEHNSNYDQYHYSMPTLSFVMKWLRVNHNLYIDIVSDVTLGFDNGKVVFRAGVYNKNIDCLWEKDSFETYENAAESAIMYALKNLI